MIFRSERFRNMTVRIPGRRSPAVFHDGVCQSDDPRVIETLTDPKVVKRNGITWEEEALASSSGESGANPLLAVEDFPTEAAIKRASRANLEGYAVERLNYDREELGVFETNAELAADILDTIDSIRRTAVERAEGDNSKSAEGAGSPEDGVDADQLGGDAPEVEDETEGPEDGVDADQSGGDL